MTPFDKAYKAIVGEDSMYGKVLSLMVDKLTEHTLSGIAGHSDDTWVGIMQMVRSIGTMAQLVKDIGQDSPISHEQANLVLTLLALRLQEHPDNPYRVVKDLDGHVITKQEIQPPKEQDPWA